MYAIVKFKNAQEVANFNQAIVNYAGWELKAPLNSDVDDCIRILEIYEAETDKVLYEYLRDLGAFEEVIIK